MAWYRVYFLSRSGDIRNVDEFEAETDAVAATFADQIHEAVSDIYEGYEVWHLSRCVARRPSYLRPVSNFASIGANIGAPRFAAESAACIPPSALCA